MYVLFIKYIKYKIIIKINGRQTKIGTRGPKTVIGK